MTAFTLFSQGNLGIGSNTSTAKLTIGCQFAVSQAVTLTGIWWFSPPGALGLPSACAVFDIGAAGIVSGTLNSSPSWAGGGANSWNKCSYPGTTTLVSGKKYQVCIYCDGTVSGNWFSSVAGYWTTGPGASGITNGPLSAPNNASSAGGQDMVQSGQPSIGLPNITENGKNYGVDVEVTLAAAASAAADPVATYVPALIAAGII